MPGDMGALGKGAVMAAGFGPVPRRWEIWFGASFHPPASRLGGGTGPAGVAFAARGGGGGNIVGGGGAWPTTG